MPVPAATAQRHADQRERDECADALRVRHAGSADHIGTSDHGASDEIEQQADRADEQRQSPARATPTTPSTPGSGCRSRSIGRRTDRRRRSASRPASCRSGCRAGDMMRACTGLITSGRTIAATGSKVDEVQDGRRRDHPRRRHDAAGDGPDRQQHHQCPERQNRQVAELEDRHASALSNRIVARMGA